MLKLLLTSHFYENPLVYIHKGNRLRQESHSEKVEFLINFNKANKSKAKEVTDLINQSFKHVEAKERMIAFINAKMRKKDDHIFKENETRLML